MADAHRGVLLGSEPARMFAFAADSDLERERQIENAVDRL